MPAETDLTLIYDFIPVEMLLSFNELDDFWIPP